MRINLKSVGVILADHMLQLLLKKSETEGKGNLAKSCSGKEIRLQNILISLTFLYFLKSKNPLFRVFSSHLIFIPFCPSNIRSELLWWYFDCLNRKKKFLSNSLFNFICRKQSNNGCRNERDWNQTELSD